MAANTTVSSDVGPERNEHNPLSVRTRFVGARRITVPLDHRGFFRIGDKGSPMVGQFKDQSLERMNAARARICAEADIAANRRAEHLRQRPRRARGKPVVVVHKKAKRLSNPAANTGARPGAAVATSLERDRRQRSAGAPGNFPFPF